MKRKSTSKQSQTDWRKLRAEDTVVTYDHPEVEVSNIVKGVVRRGLESVPTKTSISLRVDQDVLEWFKAQGPGYQTRINMVLRAYRDASA